MRPDRAIGVAIMVLALLPFVRTERAPLTVAEACERAVGAELTALCDRRDAAISHITLSHPGGRCVEEEEVLRATEAEIAALT